MSKIAFVTQSYKDDYNECRLLCESIDKFCSDIEHFIFVNDEDYSMFESLSYKRHHVFKKSVILPWYLFRFPPKIMGHHFHLSLCTIPVREWIVQQICKLGVFEILDNSVDAVFNIDSESVFMKPFDISLYIQNGKYMMYRDNYTEEPSHNDYCKAAAKLLKLSPEQEKAFRYNYMNTPVCFQRDNVKDLLERIASNDVFHSWKHALCNTYRFSEYYTYAIYTEEFLNMRNHFLTEEHTLPQIDVSEVCNAQQFSSMVEEKLKAPSALGLWLQKKSRKALANTYLPFDDIYKCIHNYWKD